MVAIVSLNICSYLRFYFCIFTVDIQMFDALILILALEITANQLYAVFLVIWRLNEFTAI